MFWCCRSWSDGAVALLVTGSCVAPGQKKVRRTCRGENSKLKRVLGELSYIGSDDMLDNMCQARTLACRYMHAAATASYARSLHHPKD